jgi:REP element-mobilizing transposase RayT
MVKVIKQFSTLYLTEVYGFCVMGNHFHLLVKMNPDKYYNDEEIQDRYKKFWKTYMQSDEDTVDPIFEFSEERMAHLRSKLSSLSEFMKDIKQTFSRFYNKRHNRRGTLWGERFKSVIVENGETLINCLAYIDLNPVRAGLVKRPEEYRWNSLGYHMQTDNKDEFLSFDFGLETFNVKTKSERVRRYRRYVYEAGAISVDIVESERENNFDVNRIQRFQYRTRYFVDSGIIGSKEFVYQNYLVFKHMFKSKEKIPKPIKGLSGIYSMKQLVEV